MFPHRGNIADLCNSLFPMGLRNTETRYFVLCKRGRGLHSVETEYKDTKVKAAVKLYQNRDPAMKMVREFEEQESMQKSTARSYSLNILTQSVSPRKGKLCPGIS